MIDDMKDKVVDTGSESSGSSSSGSSDNRGRRQNLYFKGEYGTELIPKDKECDQCSTQAVGVIIGKVDENGQRTNQRDWHAVCTRHRKKLEGKAGFNLDNYEYRRFTESNE